MTALKKMATLVTALGLLSLTACKSGPEGTYKIDKDEMKKAMDAEIEKLPEEQRGFAKLAVALIDGMNVSVELKSGGDLEMKTSMINPMKKDAAPEEKTISGKWKAEGENVTLTTEGKDITCKSEGNKLSCEGSKKGEPGLVLVKS
ncbi:MAG: hypothetical protein R3B72_12760 [Polyangiaceae bacterium]